MLLSTPGLVLHTTAYGESSVVAKVFTRQLGLRSYIIKGVRGPRGRVKQNMMQPLSCVDMVVYDSHRNDLNHVKELAARHPAPPSDAVGNGLRFFMTEVLYKALREEEPMPDLWDYVEQSALSFATADAPAVQSADLPIVFMLRVAHYLGIEPLDNYSPHAALFDLQEGHFVGVATESTLSGEYSQALHDYLASLHAPAQVHHAATTRRALLDALIAYYQLHLSGFNNFHSHEILHTILR